MANSVTIVTHDGQFHADEVASCAILTTIYPNSTIVRTRKNELIVKSDIIIDVGGEYNHQTKKYDHHQKTFHDTFAKTSAIVMSSIGLIYKHYGKEFISHIINIKKITSEESFTKFYEKIYFDVIAELDANDNGVPQYETDNYPKYFSNTNLPSVVSKFNQENIFPARGITHIICHSAII